MTSYRSLQCDPFTITSPARETIRCQGKMRGMRFPRGLLDTTLSAAPEKHATCTLEATLGANSAPLVIQLARAQMVYKVWSLARFSARSSDRASCYFSSILKVYITSSLSSTCASPQSRLLPHSLPSHQLRTCPPCQPVVPPASVTALLALAAIRLTLLVSASHRLGSTACHAAFRKSATLPTKPASLNLPSRSALRLA
ncbi:uncharacterized protein PV09_06847 [Verruconis gallopava]|uniref:Uncharacterized protein n=1 Tax=Verruconis gallopava TaxID=253628 RepID=A0A0D2A4F2_9PEZI|nr:uncharacterized protein PV09_06847 [Verruconis gallopava]KIW01663.1 hypothetical protein PV09_06847 [Verruconis gallopava]